MPAEITASYDERTRLMTWRVAILAFTIMLAGATAPVIRDAVGGRDGYRVMGVVMAAIIVVGVVGAYVGTRRAPIGRVEPGAGTLRDQLRIVAAARDFRLLLTTYVVQALATGCMLAGVDYLAEDVLEPVGATTILFVCFVGPALVLTPAVGGAGRADRQAQRATSASSCVLSLGALARGDRAVGTRGRGVRRGRGRRRAATRAARSSRWRCCRTRRPWTRAGRARTGSASTPGCGPRPRPSASRSGRACSRWCSRSAATESSTTGDVAQSDSTLTAITLGFSVLPAALVAAQPLGCRGTAWMRDEVALAEGGR